MGKYLECNAFYKSLIINNYQDAFLEKVYITLLRVYMAQSG